jgi:UDP-N-acetylglucosamine/UDP-N-acetylgalactosamine diphosphorylase
VKNSDEEATDNPRTARAAMIEQARRWLREAGATVADDVAVEINPLWAGTIEEIKQRLKPGTVIREPTYFK